MFVSVSFSRYLIERYPKYMHMMPVIAPLICCMAVACQSTQTASSKPTSTQLAAMPASDCWPFRPNKIIVHPLSYFPGIFTNAESKNVDIYIECLDKDGQSTRSIGYLSLNVQDPKSTSSSSFECNLSDLVQNKKYWDSVSRCYRIVLALPKGFECQTDALLMVSATLNVDSDDVLATQNNVPCPIIKTRDITP